MTTFNFELNNKPNKTGLYNIQIRITQNKRHKRIKTSVYVKSRNDFNAIAKNENWVRKSEPLQAKYNAILKDELQQAKDTYQELKNENQASLENIKNRIVSSETSDSFLEFAKERTLQIYNEGSYRNYKKYNGFINKLEEFLKTTNKTDVLFVEITPEFIYRFDSYLKSLENSRRKGSMLHPNSIAKIFDIFKALINLHFRLHRLNPNASPFTGFSGGKTIPTTKQKLSIAEIQKLADLDLPADTPIWHSRNCFMFSFYFAGIRAADVLQMRWSNITSDGRLVYTMDKSDKIRDLNIHDKALELLRLYYRGDSKQTDYIFPFLDSKADYAKATSKQMISTLPPEMVVKLLDTVNRKNTLVDKYLKEIAQMAGIDVNVTLHIARHSFAKRAAEVKISNNITKLMLAHSNIKETENYMGNFNTEAVDNAMNTIFSYDDDYRAQLISKVREMSTEQVRLLLISYARLDNFMCFLFYLSEL